MKWDIKIKEDTGNGYIVEDETGSITEVSYEIYHKVYDKFKKNYEV